jgi:hypothetical protein
MVKVIHAQEYKAAAREKAVSAAKKLREMKLRAEETLAYITLVSTRLWRSVKCEDVYSKDYGTIGH